MKNEIKAIVHKLKTFTLDVFAPRKCAGCKKRNESFCAECSRQSFKYGAGCVFCNFRNNTGKICRQCQKQYSAPILQILWAGEYKHPVKNAVKELKYRSRLELAKPLAELIYKKFIEYNPKYEKENFVAIPVPMHPKKEFIRGYNQAQLLAEEFSKLSGIELATYLEKSTDTQTQVETKKREERIKNLDGAFVVNIKNDLSSTWVKNKTIILIDDVATTGATFMHASLALSSTLRDEPSSSDSNESKVKGRAPKITCLAIAHGYG